MEKEALEVIDSPENAIHLTYELPRFWKRVFANFLDIVFLVLAFITVFIAVQKTAEATPQYQRADAIISRTRSDSQIFRYASSRKTWENISTYLDNNNDVSYSTRVYICEVAIDDFITFIQNNCTTEQYESVVKDYKDCRLSERTVDSGNRHLFITSIVDGEEKIIKNPDAVAGSQYYYEHFYREYTLVNCGGFLVSFFPNYRNALQTQSNILFFIQIPITLFVSSFIVYYLPGLIFRRGRPTFGKKILSIGTVDSNVVSPKFGRYTAKFAIFFFGEIVLSLFTFGVPLIISFSMMAFTKRKTGFPDFMLGLTEVDTIRQKIYFSKYEVSLDHSPDHKDPIDFKMVNKE